MRKRLVTLLMVLGLALVGAMPVFAQAGPTFRYNPTGISMLTYGVPNGARFQEFLRHHPRTAAQLQKNPNLLYDPNWRQSHPEFQQFMRNHPKVWEGVLSKQGISKQDERWHGFLASHPRAARQLNANPNLLYDPAWRRAHPDVQQFLSKHHQVRNRLWTSAPWNAYPSTYDRFTSNHPGISRQLNQNPALVNDPRFLSQHPQFNDYMRNHPGLHRDMRDRAEYWHRHRSYQGFRWRHAWSDPNAEPQWIPPGLRKQHPPGRAYGWEKQQEKWAAKEQRREEKHLSKEEKHQGEHGNYQGKPEKHGHQGWKHGHGHHGGDQD